MHPIGIAYKWRERIGELTKENKELKKTLAAAEERGKELEGMVEDEIYSRDFYRRKLAAAETKLEAVRGVIEQSEDYVNATMSEIEKIVGKREPADKEAK